MIWLKHLNTVRFNMGTHKGFANIIVNINGASSDHFFRHPIDLARPRVLAQPCLSPCAPLHCALRQKAPGPDMAVSQMAIDQHFFLALMPTMVVYIYK
jgi:hypothetical protein